MSRVKASKLDVSGTGAPLQNTALSSLDALLGGVELPPGGDIRPGPAEAHPKPVKKGRLILRRETKNRGGKTVVVVSGLDPFKDDMDGLARSLRKTLGCGGTVEAGEVVLQGDRPAAVAEALEAMGYRVGGVTS